MTLISLFNLTKLSDHEKIILAKLITQYRELTQSKSYTINGSKDCYYVTHDVTKADIQIEHIYVRGEGQFLGVGGQGRVNSFNSIIYCHPEQEQIVVIPKSVVRKSHLHHSLSKQMERLTEEAITNQHLLLAGNMNRHGQIFSEQLPGRPFNSASSKFKQIKLIDRVGMLIPFITQLDTFHEKGYVHRDIKPDNLMFDKVSKTLRLIDTGCADKIAGSKTSGTCIYFPPEYESTLANKRKGLALSNPPQSHPSFDIYQAGIILASTFFDTQIFVTPINTLADFTPVTVNLPNLIVDNLYASGNEKVSKKRQEQLCDLTLSMLKTDAKLRPEANDILNTLISIYNKCTHEDKERAAIIQFQQIEEVKLIFSSLMNNLLDETQAQSDALLNAIQTIDYSPDSESLKTIYKQLCKYYYPIKDSLELLDFINQTIKENELNAESLNIIGLQNLAIEHLQTFQRELIEFLETSTKENILCDISSLPNEDMLCDGEDEILLSLDEGVLSPLSEKEVISPIQFDGVFNNQHTKLCSDYSALQNGFKLIKVINAKIANPKYESIRVRLLAFKNEVINYLNNPLADNALATLNNFGQQLDEISCKKDLLINMHERFLSSKIRQGDKRIQRQDFIALLRKLFSDPPVPSLSASMKTIKYLEKTDLLNQGLYRNYRTVLLSYNHYQLTLIKDEYIQWIRAGTYLTSYTTPWGKSRCQKMLNEISLFIPLQAPPIQVESSLDTRSTLSISSQ